MAFNFYSYLKKNKSLIIQGVEKGGRPTTPAPTTVNQETPCNESVEFPIIFEDPFILSVNWNTEFDNGIVNITLDEFYNDVWNRRLISGIANPASLTIDEQRNGIQGTITERCGVFFLQRYRVVPSQLSLLLASSNGKQISEQQRNEILGCRSPI